MVVAGIDEAGYGPLLGPLVVGCAAFDVGNADGDEPPCLWKRLADIVSRKKSRSGRKLHVNDSKQVYSPSTGLKELERSVLAFASARFGPIDGLGSMLAHVAPPSVPELAKHAWYQSPAGETFPLEQPAVAVRIAAGALAESMDRSGVRCAHLCARVLPEGQLNRLFAATRNKSTVLFTQAASHIDHLLRSHAQAGLVIWCDQQGGRERYGPLLRLMFEDWALEVLKEGDGVSEYRLSQGSRWARIAFAEKAEGKCLAVALASMLSKYLREALMRRFNAWWRNVLPDLAPTAGYYEDGLRFLQDTQAKRAELRIADADLIRTR